MIPRTVSVATITARALWPRSLWIAAALLGGAVAAAFAHPDVAEEPVDTRVGWLHTALVLLAAWIVVRCIESWPAFGRERGDGLWTRRLRIGVLDGGGPALATSLGVLAVLGALVAVAFDALARPGRDAALLDREVLALAPDSPDRLDDRRPRIELRFASSARFETLVLRPTPVLRATAKDFECRFDLLLDGARDPDGPFVLDLSTRVLKRPLARSITRIAVVRLGGDLALEWPRGTAHATRRLATPRILGAALAGATACADALVALAFALLARRALAVPVLHALALAAVAFQALTGHSALASAFAAHSRDVLCQDEATRSALLRALGLAGLCVSLDAAAATLRRR